VLHHIICSVLCTKGAVGSIYILCISSTEYSCIAFLIQCVQLHACSAEESEALALQQAHQLEEQVKLRAEIDKYARERSKEEVCVHIHTPYGIYQYVLLISILFEAYYSILVCMNGLYTMRVHTCTYYASECAHIHIYVNHASM
jgi:hypothetical protein